MLIIATGYGEFRQDGSDVWHYAFKMGGDVGGAAEDAIDSLPGSPSYFWFNGTYCPIQRGDTPAELVYRWYEWRVAYQEGKLLEKITEYSRAG